MTSGSRRAPTSPIPERAEKGSDTSGKEARAGSFGGMTGAYASDAEQVWRASLTSKVNRSELTVQGSPHPIHTGLEAGGSEPSKRARTCLSRNRNRST